jgi:hypothetical protein
VFPDCKDGRIVADVVRLEKGHTEGFEPSVTEHFVKLIVISEEQDPKAITTVRRRRQ